jgi:hypothetical protein
MRNQTWTGLFFLLFSLVTGMVQAQTCQPESIPASTPDSQLQDNGDGTVTDTKTGLMWKQCVEGLSGSGCASGSAEQLTWPQALQRAQAVNSGGGFAGHHDWRVPNIKELNSLIEHQCVFPAINLRRFPNSSSDEVWSSSTGVIYHTKYVWSVAFNYGYTNLGSSGQSPHPIRLVRSAP